MTNKSSAFSNDCTSVNGVSVHLQDLVHVFAKVDKEVLWRCDHDSPSLIVVVSDWRPLYSTAPIAASWGGGLPISTVLCMQRANLSGKV